MCFTILQILYHYSSLSHSLTLSLSHSLTLSLSQAQRTQQQVIVREARQQASDSTLAFQVWEGGAGASGSTLAFELCGEGTSLEQQPGSFTVPQHRIDNV